MFIAIMGSTSPIPQGHVMFVLHLKVVQAQFQVTTCVSDHLGIKEQRQGTREQLKVVKLWWLPVPADILVDILISNFVMA